MATPVLTTNAAAAKKPALIFFERSFAFIEHLFDNPWTACAIIFLFALALRWLYNCAWLEHRVCHVGDAFNFLRSGTALLAAIVSSHSLSDFLHQIIAPGATQFNPIQSMASSALSDRLSIDGPVIPSYLALVEWICGINPLQPVFDNKITQISLCNSILDSGQCVLMYLCGRLGFNRRTGLIAGLLFAVYPGAIINTQHCYSEPLTYFILTGWMALVLRVRLTHVHTSAALWLALGAATGLLMLSKPAFVLLPVMVTAWAFWRNISRWRLNRSVGGKPIASPKQVGSLLAGAAMFLAPWLLFNKTVTGNLSLFVNRVPAFNLFHGNQLSTDGWRIHPFNGYYPADMGLVVHSILDEAGAQPLVFAAMELKKIARIWTGVWNEFQYEPFGFTLELQYLLHQILIFLAVIGLSLAVSAVIARRNHKALWLSRTFDASVLLTIIAGFHFSYVPFETISRYAITAMPAIILMAAFTIDQAIRKERLSQMLALLSVAAGTFSVIAADGKLAKVVASTLPLSLSDCSAAIAWFVGALATTILFLLAARYLYHPNRRAMALGLLPLAFTTNLLLLSSLAYALATFENYEWSAVLKNGETIRQRIVLPAAVPQSRVAFVLLDLTCSQPTPSLTVSINGTAVESTPFPLAQLQPDNADIVQCLAIQGQAMAKDMRTFRHWWVLPFSAELLKPGSENEILVRNEGEATTLFGDRPRPRPSASADGARFLPSLSSYTYTKGFSTFDHGHARTFEKVQILGKTMSDDKVDLSSAPGLQNGCYRLRILACPGSPAKDNTTQMTSAGTGIPTGASAAKSVGTTANVSRASVPAPVPATSAGATAEVGRASVPAMGQTTSVGATPCVAQVKAVSHPVFERRILTQAHHLVEGYNPLTFTPPGTPVALPSTLPSHARLQFSCEVQRLRGFSPSFVSVTLRGIDANNNAVSWNSPWQTSSVESHKGKWIRASFSDIVPDQILALQDLKAQILVSPFQSDFLFLKRKEAIRSELLVRNMKLEILPPLPLPDKRLWQIF